MSIGAIDVILTVMSSAVAAGLLSTIRAALTRRSRIKLKVGDVEIELDPTRVDETVTAIQAQLESIRAEPRVMVVYSHEDKTFVERLVADLRRNGVDVWLDSERLRLGDRIDAAVSDAVRNSHWIIVVPPPALDAPKYVNREIALAIESEKERQRPFILPVRPDERPIHPALADRMYADFSKQYDAGLQELLRRIQRAAPRTV